MGEAGNQNLVTTQTLAKFFKKTTRRIEQLKAEGVIKGQGKPTKYDLLPTVQAYIEYLETKAYGKEQKQVTADLEERKLRAEAEIKESKAAIAKMEQEELDGKLHRSEDVKAITTDHVLYMRSMLMSMPGKLAVDCANCGSAAEVAEIIKTEVYFILNSLADYRYDPDEYKKRVMERSGWEVEQGEQENE